ncbi:TonB-dependent receptor plug domain-containing protein [Ralstonia mannitolilytica]|uniref:TonB-dependent receptor plug domain-containing protein n=1 Tax=Ralstonia mannitolilytica TaxID=105219 RepID=UPI0007B00253|nr:TonB-dependent receptor [Ralstonia mannitolilytica]ANA35867.1 TonB-dependent receptor [Ralstonia mannitolilytica]
MFAVLCTLLCSNSHAETDLTELPIEQLMQVQVVTGASKYAQASNDAPANVSVITADDIKAHGWRTLADILRSLPGLYTNYDRNYTTLGARGFLRAGDYDTRFLLLIDGFRTNDPIFDQAAVGTDAQLNVDLIERVEYVPGAGSAVYGSNALFGVINVITKRGRDIGGVQVSGFTGSPNAPNGREGRVTWGQRADNGAEWLLSASMNDAPGRDLYFGEFNQPGVSDGVARGMDFDRARRLFAKGGFGEFGLSFGYADRTKGVPTAPYDQSFNDPRSRTVDTRYMLNGTWQHALDDMTDVSARLYWGHYVSQGDYTYNPPPAGINRDIFDTAWYGTELKLVTRRIERHTVAVGAELQRDYRDAMRNFDTVPYVSYLDDHRSNHRMGLYLQDQFAFHSDWLLDSGLRYDHTSFAPGIFSPRVGLIWHATPSTTVKTIYGMAYRAPNDYELHYQTSAPGGEQLNSQLSAERIRTYEAVLEQRVAAGGKATVSVFQNNVSNLISQSEDPDTGLLFFSNVARVRTRGVELGYEQHWPGGARLRTSYSFQHSEDLDTGQTLTNSPRHMLKLNATVPVWREGWRAGVEAQYISSRLTTSGAPLGRVGGYWIANLTVAAARLLPNLEMSASLYNVFGRRYADPAGPELVQPSIRQDGRSLGVKFTYTFR